MATFSYQCQKCKKIFELDLKIGQNDIPTFEPCPYCHQTAVTQIIMGSPTIGDSYSLGRHPLPDEWKGFLRRVKEKNPGSNINI